MAADALVEDVVSVRPPPLPPRRPKKRMVVLGLLVALLAAALGIGLGTLLTGPERAEEAAASGVTAPAKPAGNEGKAVPLELDPVVISADEEGPE